ARAQSPEHGRFQHRSTKGAAPWSLKTQKTLATLTHLEPTRWGLQLPQSSQNLSWLNPLSDLAISTTWSAGRCSLRNMHIPSGQLSERYGRACDRSVLCLTAPTKRAMASSLVPAPRWRPCARARQPLRAHRTGTFARGCAFRFWEDQMHEPQ